MRVFVLLFNAGTDNEGIHTLRLRDGNGRDRNVLLMFASEDDATRFGLMLEAQDFPEAKVEEIDEAEVREFCESAGYDCHLVEAGDLVVPPETNLEADDMDWQKDARRSPPSWGEFPDANAARNESERELDRIRSQLERLL